MTIRRHTSGQWSDQVSAAQLVRFRSWDMRADPDTAYADHGWSTVLTSTSPVYDPKKHRRLLSSEPIRTDNADGTYTWTVDRQPWQVAIEFNVQAKDEAVSAVEAVRVASIAAGIPIILPTGSTLDGVDASGQTVRLHLDGHPITDYWDKVGQAVQLGTASPTFDSLDGRCVVGNQYMLTICRIVAAAKSKAFTATRDAERAIELGKYNEVLAMAQSFSAQGAPAAVDVAAVYAAST